MRFALCALRNEYASAALTLFIFMVPATLLRIVNGNGGPTVENHWEGNKVEGRGFPK